MSKIIKPRDDWDQPCCERCWLKNTSKISTTGELEIRKPVLLHQDYVSLERCAWCGDITIIGLFVRADPNDVMYPSRAKAQGVN